MKDKEKQINDIVNLLDIRDVSVSYWDYYNDDVNKNYRKELENVAKIITNAGYRKIDKDSIVLTEREFLDECELQYNTGYQKALADLEKDGKVVLSKEEYERLKGKRPSCNCETLIKQERKETAEKIITNEIKTIKNIRDACILPEPAYRKGYIDCCNGILFYLENNIAKQFGVEIKE